MKLKYVNKTFKKKAYLKNRKELKYVKNIKKKSA